MISKTKLLALAVALLILVGGCASRAELPNEAEAVLAVVELETPEPDPEPEPELEEDEPLAERGAIEDEVYLNPSIGLTFTLPEGWEFADEETIAMMMGVGVELIAENGGFELDFASINALYDMVAYNALSDSNTMVMIEKLVVPPESEPPTSQAQLAALRERLEEMDVFGFEFGRPFTVWVAGEPFDALPIQVGNDESKTRQYYLVRMHGSYMVTIIASLFEDITFSELLEHFV